MKQDRKIFTTKSGGDVIRDLGVADSDGLLLKAEIAMKVVRIIEERGLTQVEAAALLGIRQPKISALMNGKISGFSVERLLHCLTKLGHDVTIRERKRRNAQEGRLQFIADA